MNIGIFVSDEPALPEPLIKRATDFLSAYGIQVTIYESAYQVNSAKDKADLIHAYLEDGSIDVLMPFWGGVKTIELLPYLDFELIKASNKPIVGYSDTTCLLQAINSQTGLATYHGPALISFAKKIYREESIEALLSALSSQAYRLPQPLNSNIQPHSGLDPIIADNDPLIIVKEGHTAGYSLAGNLQTLLLLNGTRYQIQLRDKILFIEDDESINEALFRRYLSQLTLMDDFSEINGLVISRFTHDSKLTSETVNNILGEYEINKYGFPIIINANSGHCDPIITVPNNVLCNLDAESNKVDVVFGASYSKSL